MRTQVDVTETAAANLAADSIIVSDTEILLSISISLAVRASRRAGSDVPLSSCWGAVNLERLACGRVECVWRKCVGVQSSRGAYTGEIQPARVFRSVREALPTRR